MEKNEKEQRPKSSKAILTFGILVLGSGLVTIFLFIIGQKVPDVMSKARFMFALTSFSGVAFMVYMKEIRAVGNWKDIPIAFRFIWWSIFIGNALNFVEYVMTTFIL